MRRALAAMALLAAVPAQAQIVPEADPANPTRQTALYYEGQDYILTASADGGLLVFLEPGERIDRIEVADLEAVDIDVEKGADSFRITPRPGTTGTAMTLRTDRRVYNLQVRTVQPGDAPSSVRFTYQDQSGSPAMPGLAEATIRWSYSLRGDNEVRPETLWDDGERTYIGYANDQPLPAVFALNAVGDEEVVNGYMRGDFFVIDRIYSELVFRIDKERARARRNAEADSSDG